MRWNPYHSERRRRVGRSMETWELLLSIVVFAVVVGMLVVFVVFFHDVPFRA